VKNKWKDRKRCNSPKLTEVFYAPDEIIEKTASAGKLWASEQDFYNYKENLVKDRKDDITLPNMSIPPPHIKPWWKYAIENGVVTSSSIYESSIAEVFLSFQASENGLCCFYEYTHNIEYKYENKKQQEILDILHKKLLKTGGILSNKSKYHSVYFWTTAYLKLSEDSITLLSTDPQLFYLINSIISKYTKEQVKPEGKVFVLLPTQSGLQSTSIGLGAIPLIRENYRQDVLEGYDRAVKDLQAKDPLGRLFIFDGPPGTGKTYLIRALLNDLPNLKFLILPSNMMSSLTGPELLAAIINAADEGRPIGEKRKTQPIALIIEDADSCLSSRSSDNISAISSILNISDGIVGNLLDLRIICTTNAEIENIDKAILRTGRLSARVEVGLLEPSQAKAVYQRLDGKENVDFTEKKFYTLSDVYALAKGCPDAVLQNNKEKRKVGFNV